MHYNSSVSIRGNRLLLSISYHSTVKSSKWRILMFGNNPSCPRWIYPVFHAVQVRCAIKDQVEYGWTIRRGWVAEGWNHGADEYLHWAPVNLYHYLHWVPLNVSQPGTRLIVESCCRELSRASPSLHPPSAASHSFAWDNRTREPGFVRAYAELRTLR